MRANTIQDSALAKRLQRETSAEVLFDDFSTAITAGPLCLHNQVKRTIFVDPLAACRICELSAPVQGISTPAGIQKLLLVRVAANDILRQVIAHLIPKAEFA